MEWVNPRTNLPETQNYDWHWMVITCMTKDVKKGEITLQVSTWGGKATLSLNTLWNNIIGTPCLIYFEQK